MSKRILPIMLVVMMCLALFPLPVAAAENATATYTDGVVTIAGTGFANGISYVIRVVDTSKSSITAMGQTTADGSGNISASITTGTLTALKNYTVYINNLDGTKAAQILSIIDTSDTSSPAPTSGGAGNGSINTATVIPGQGNTVIVSLEVAAVIDSKTNTASVNIDKNIILDLAEKAKVAEASGKKIEIELKVKSSENVTAVKLEITKEALKQITDNTSAGIKIITGMGSMTFDTKAVDFINDSSTGDIIIEVKKAEKSSLPAEIRAKVGLRPVYNFSVRSGNATISSFGGGSVKVSIPYTPQREEKYNSIVVYYIDNAGNVKTVMGQYSPTTKSVNFTTSHFSEYAVGYNEASFKDVITNAWYSDAVGFMAARGIVNGVGNNMFAPEKNVTRADFLIMVMKAYGMEIDSTLTDNFADAGNKYYTSYLATAKHMGLVSGVGKNRYAPEATISRQDMLVILYNVLNKRSELPSVTSGKNLSGFADSGSVSGYAIDAVTLFVESGIISGDGVNLDPKTNSTRAQVIQVLYNLLSKIDQ